MIKFLTFFVIVLLAQASNTSEIIDARLCQMDKQVRMIVIRKEKLKFLTVFYKQNEALISGRFVELEAANLALLEVEKNLTELGWTCKPVTAEYL